jgi:hypothetical protein
MMMARALGVKDAVRAAGAPQNFLLISRNCLHGIVGPAWSSADTRSAGVGPPRGRALPPAPISSRRLVHPARLGGNRTSAIRPAGPAVFPGCSEITANDGGILVATAENVSRTRVPYDYQLRGIASVQDAFDRAVGALSRRPDLSPTVTAQLGTEVLVDHGPQHGRTPDTCSPR